ncbi:MAG TPA: tetratricopeptide repeat protein, partial [Chitinophagales bacterium]|nr:tetratricopeptide repeat protein [Chitinophagales bacterium]
MNNELIKKYLADELSPIERNAFEQDMENDPFLKEAVEGLAMASKKNPKQQLHELEEKLKKNIDNTIQASSQRKSFTNVFFKYAAAACLIGVLGLLSYNLFFIEKTINEQEIFANYYKPLTHPDATVRGDTKTNAETKAIQAYENENYFEAVNAYQKLVDENPDNVKNNLFLGISYLSTNQPKKAITHLKSITASEEFHYDIQWYLALAYLKNKNIEQAQSIIYHLAHEENYYQKEAKEILEKLDGKIALKE